MNTNYRVLSRHSSITAAKSALSGIRASFEENGREYANQVGHRGKRLYRMQQARLEPRWIIGYADQLGSGEEYAIIEDDDAFFVVSRF